MAFIIISNLRVIEVNVERCDREFALIQTSKGERFMVRKSRIFQTFDEAFGHFPHRKGTEMTTPRVKKKTPYDYEPGGSMWQKTIK